MDCTKCFKPIAGTPIECFGVLYHTACAPRTGRRVAAGPTVKKAKRGAADRYHSMPQRAEGIKVTISGGTRDERVALTSEFVALLNSLHVLVGVTTYLPSAADSDEHEERIRTLSKTTTIYFKETDQ